MSLLNEQQLKSMGSIPSSAAVPQYDHEKASPALKCVHNTQISFFLSCLCGLEAT